MAVHSRLSWFASTLLVAAAGACIEVGHEAETGCFVNSREPGCRPTGGSGGSAAAGSSGAGTAARGGASAGGSDSGGTSGSAGDAGAPGEAGAGGEGGG